jgi:hypothetical protein
MQLTSPSGGHELAITSLDEQCLTIFSKVSKTTMTWIF